MNIIETATKKFIQVRNRLNTPETMQAYRTAHYKPLRFYYEHNVEDAISILLQETETR